MAKLSRIFKQLTIKQPLSKVHSEIQPGHSLRRVLSWPMLITIGLGTMLGAIFTTVGVGMAEAGPAVILSFVLSGVVCLFVALCYAEFSSIVHVSGSAYTYSYATLGQFVAWIIGWNLILEYGISAAPVATSCSGYIQQFLASYHILLPAWAQTAKLVVHHWPVTIGHWHFNLIALDFSNSKVDLIAGLLVLAISAVLIIGIEASAMLNMAFVLIELIVFIIYIFVCRHAIHLKNFYPFMPTHFHGVVTSAALVFFAFIGFDTVTVASEEAINPKTHVPIGVIGSLIIGGLLYIIISAVTVGVVPWQIINQSAAMGQAVQIATKETWAFYVIIFGATVGNVSVMLTSLLGQTRIFYVMAMDGLLPPRVSKIHARFKTPARMTLITGITVAFLAAITPLKQLLEIVNIGTLTAFAIVCLGIFILRYTSPDVHRDFKAPLGRFCSLAGCLLCIYLIIEGLSEVTWLRFIVWSIIGMILYAAYGYRKSILQAQKQSKTPV